MDLWHEIKNKLVHPSLHDSARLTPLDELHDDENEEVRSLETSDLSSLSGLAIILEYVDSKGSSTSRLITCTRYDQHGNEGYLRAFCHMRMKTRQFKISRITEIFDPSSGESLGAVDQFFTQFDPNQIHASAPGWGLSVAQRSDFTALLNSLVFVANCDRDFHQLERTSLEDFIGRYWWRMELAGDPDCDSIMSYADRIAPDAETFWVSLHRIAENPKLIKILKESVIDMMEADGHLAEQEFYWGAKIDEFFRSNV